MHTLVYSNTQSAITWKGLQVSNGPEFTGFMTGEVASRLHDETGKTALESHLHSLASTGFAQESLQNLFDAELPEERDWAVGEALAEAWLTREHGVIWPWNMERDKRTPLASLPGADLIGFVLQNGETRLVFGEVKCSSDKGTPPNVMTGKSGMTRQLENLATDITLLHTLIRWLQPRCRKNEAEPHFNAAITLLLQSGNKAMALFGVLVRDTCPDERDLRNCGQSLAKVVKNPTRCDLLALYLPCPINTLPQRVKSGSQ